MTRPRTPLAPEHERLMRQIERMWRWRVYGLLIFCIAIILIALAALQPAWFGLGAIP